MRSHALCLAGCVCVMVISGTVSWEAAAVAGEGGGVLDAHSETYMDAREGLANSRIRFERDKEGRVAFLGGSITTQTGWRDHTCDTLKKLFPDTRFDFLNAGIGGTDSTFGAMRFERDVFKNGPVDLLFLEFAVNDEGGGPGDVHRMRAMEGIIRHARKLNPNIDIVVQYLADTGKVAAIDQGGVSPAVADHDVIARYYNLPVIYNAKEVAHRIAKGEFAWEGFSGDSCHPNAFGHELYGTFVAGLLAAAWPGAPSPDARIVPHDMPPALDPLNYENGRLVNPSEAEVVSGWQRDPAWKAEKTCNYGGPVDVLAGLEPGAELRLKFNGSLVGISGIAGMDAGVIEYSIDGGPFQKKDLFDHYCTRFHRPVCHILGEAFATGEHQLVLRIAEERNEKSEGHAVRILDFVCN